MKNHIILDTDVGGDADDACAIRLAVNSPEISLDLVVTNDEHKGHRARFVEEWFRFWGQNIPVVAGTDLGNTRYCLITGMLNFPEEQVDTDFLERIAETVEKNSMAGTMTDYVCIGPQSNLARFINSYPELKDRVNITLMGGGLEKYRHGDKKAEHNVRYDVPAALKVFYSDWDKRYVLGDTTHDKRIVMGEGIELYKRLAEDEANHTQYFVESMRQFFTRSYFDKSLMHDPLTLSSIISDEFVQFQTKRVSMDENGIMQQDPQGKETIVSVGADYERFWNLFEERMLL